MSGRGQGRTWSGWRAALPRIPRCNRHGPSPFRSIFWPCYRAHWTASGTWGRLLFQRNLLHLVIGSRASCPSRRNCDILIRLLHYWRHSHRPHWHCRNWTRAEPRGAHHRGTHHSSSSSWRTHQLHAGRHPRDHARWPCLPLRHHVHLWRQHRHTRVPWSSRSSSPHLALVLIFL